MLSTQKRTDHWICIVSHDNEVFIEDLQSGRVGNLGWTRSKVGLSLVVAVGWGKFVSFRHGSGK